MVVKSAYEGAHLLQCKYEETKTADRAKFFHTSTQAWIQARQKLFVYRDQLPEGMLSEAEMKSIFDAPDPNQQRDAGKIPLDDLRAVREKVYQLRKILEEKVKAKLKEM